VLKNEVFGNFNTHTIDLENLENGCYFINFVSDTNKLNTLKFVIGM
jgi:hypothetical protein